MGWKNEKGEHMEWTDQNTRAFIGIVYCQVKKKQLQGSTFEIAIWEDINNKLKNITGQNFGIDRLKKKFDRLHNQHREFSTRDAWDYYNTQGQICKKFKKQRFEPDYDMLGEIFNHSTATRKLGHASTQDPPSSDEERAIEGAFLSRGFHIDPNAVDTDGYSMHEFDKRRKTIGSSSVCQRDKEAKNSRLDKLEAALSKWTELMNVRTEASKAKADLYKAQANEATSGVTDLYSIEACMELLDSMEDVPSKIYNNALVKFKDKEWRYMFIKMPSFRKKGWLASLE